MCRGGEWYVVYYLWEVLEREKSIENRAKRHEN